MIYDICFEYITKKDVNKNDMNKNIVHMRNLIRIEDFFIFLFAHSSLDGIFDYGLKHSDNFKHPHLTAEN